MTLGRLFRIVDYGKMEHMWCMPCLHRYIKSSSLLRSPLSVRELHFADAANGSHWTSKKDGAAVAFRPTLTLIGPYPLCARTTT